MTEKSPYDLAREAEFVAFRAGALEFCINIMSVREIRGWTPATAIPRAPSYIRGVINLRGAVVPVIDLSGPTPGPSACRSRSSTSPTTTR